MTGPAAGSGEGRRPASAPAKRRVRWGPIDGAWRMRVETECPAWAIAWCAGLLHHVWWLGVDVVDGPWRAWNSMAAFHLTPARAECNMCPSSHRMSDRPSAPSRWRQRDLDTKMAMMMKGVDLPCIAQGLVSLGLREAQELSRFELRAVVLAHPHQPNADCCPTNEAEERGSLLSQNPPRDGRHRGYGHPKQTVRVPRCITF